ncbi:MAG: hypothetical protein RMH84_00810 [Sulfolobales archaeon]|nr:hypothetical protein [Sulfolobales archaeon]MCX8208282.1 hypothetical protein [Sulfolobales archaeon]MDW8010126.1 hypothetical protein [Sulfolobales archaeon]
MTTVLVPLNISGFWVPYRGDSYLNTGSVGASLTLEPPVSFKLTRSSCPLYLNGVCFEEYHPVARELLRLGISVHGMSPVPLGVGSAVSGAIAIALAYAYLHLSEGGELDAGRVGLLAHRIEVETSGGLGDVICQLVGGGLVLRKKPGPPGIGEVVSIPVRDVEVTLGVLGERITTKEMLLKFADRFAAAGSRAFTEFTEKPELEFFLRLSREFSIEVGFAPREVFRRLDEVLRSLSGAVLGYFIKKSLLVVVHELGLSSAVRSAISRFCQYSLPPFKPAKRGFTVVS